MKQNIKSVFRSHQSWFLPVAAVLLLATAFAKVISAFGEVDILAEPDPVFPFLSQRAMLIVAAVLEMTIAGYLLLSEKWWRRILLVAWLATLFLGYRVGLWAVGYEGSCGCLGHLTDPLGIDPKTSDWVMKGMLTYLLAFSVIPLIQSRLQRKSPTGPGMRREETGSLAT